ncbi:hypothetical protein Tco_0404657 [Tanacetum coccineum]
MALIRIRLRMYVEVSMVVTAKNFMIIVTHHCDGVNEVTNQSLKGWEDPGVKAMQGLDTDATFAGESFDVNNAIKEKRSFVIVDAIYWFSS